MNVQRKKESEFPFDIVFTINNAEEARALYAIFNYCPNTELLPELDPSARHAIGEKFSIIPPSSEIANGVTYSKFYSRKETA